MSLITRIKDFLKRIFSKKYFSKDTVFESCVPVDTSQEEGAKESLEQFKMRNIIFQKLNYLEQYIKVFSLPFPNEYNHYLGIIQAHRDEYNKDLEEYKEGLIGELTFAIDPEKESDRLIIVSNLEAEIKNFVEMTVNFSMYQNKFAKLSLKLNEFYNALLDTSRGVDEISAQLRNAISSAVKLVEQIKNLQFFTGDSRKKEVMLNYIIYFEYIFFKTSLRCFLVKDLDEYKSSLSKFYPMFIDSEYDKLIFKFFIDNLEQHQGYLSENPNLALEKSCQELQNKLNDYVLAFGEPNFFMELIRFENTINTLSDNAGYGFTIAVPHSLEVNTSQTNSVISVKDTAISVLTMLDSNKARILCHIMRSFTSDISWREFFFICKIFELCNDVISVANTSIFSIIKAKFEQLEAKYDEYSDKFIRIEKEKLLSYNGSKSKKYIFILEADSLNMPTVYQELKKLYLDFHIVGRKVYLNYSYFHGFKNLERNFGDYITLEELI